jgi:hypothetical protein
MENPRDAEIKKINIKNSPEELISFVEGEFEGVKGFNPLTASGMVLHGDNFISVAKNEEQSYFVDDKYVEEDIFNFVGVNNTITDKYLIELGSRYISSNYFGDLTVVFLPSSFDFSDVISKALVIDFSRLNRSFELIDFLGVSNENMVTHLKNPNVNNIEILRVRADIMVGAFNAGLPIEDLSIGFQIKMYRSPNVYNFGFWSHFTNNEFIQLSIT